jgi:hypothetical protein
MAKRRATPETDDEIHSLDTTPASKRARTEDSEDVTDSPAPKRESKRAVKEKRRARFRDDDDEDDEDDDEADVKEEKDGDGDPHNKEDQDFEDEHAEAIRKALEAKREVQGVSNLITLNFSCLTHITGHCGARYYRSHRNAPVHVPQIPHLPIWPSNQLYYR